MTNTTTASGCSFVPLFASAEWKSKTSNFIRSRNFSCIADEPRDFGGSDLGANPAEILLWSVAGCVSIGAELFASRDGVELECLKTDVSGRMLTNPLYIAQLSITVSIKGNASAEKLEGLVRESFEASPIVGSLKVKPQLIVKTE